MNDNEITASDLINDYVITYGKYVISEMFPTYIDGLKAVIRRSLWKLRDTHGGFISSQDALGRIFKLHPHNPDSTYQSIIRLTQTFSTMNPFFELKGDEGNYSGDRYANYRYTEMKISDFAYDVFFSNIDTKTLTYVVGDDLFTIEPKYLIPKIPVTLLLYNHCVGFGFTSIIPSHDLRDIWNLVYAYLEYRNNRTSKANFEKIADKMIPVFPINNNIIGKNPITLEGTIEFVNPYTFFIKTIPFGSEINTLKKKLLTMMKNNVIEEYKMAANKNEETNILITIKNNKNIYATLDKFLRTIGFTNTFNPIYNFNKDNYTINLSKFNLIDSWFEMRRKTIVSQINNKLVNIKKRIFEIRCYLLIIDDLDYVIDVIRKSEKEQARSILKSKFKITLNQSNIILNTPLKTLTKSSKRDLNVELEKAKQIKNELISSLTSIEDTISNDVETLAKKYRRTEHISNIPKYIGYISIDNMLSIQYENHQELERLLNVFRNKFINVFQYGNGDEPEYFLKFKKEFKEINANMKYRLSYRYFNKIPSGYFVNYKNGSEVKKDLEVDVFNDQRFLYKKSLIVYVKNISVKIGYLSNIHVTSDISFMKNIPNCEGIVVFYGNRKIKNKVRMQYMDLNKLKKLLSVTKQCFIIDIVPFDIICQNEYYLNIPYCYSQYFNKSYTKILEMSGKIIKEPFIEKALVSNIRI